jgi:hypothetical protein
MFRTLPHAGARRICRRAQYWPAAALSAKGLTTLLLFGAVSASAFAASSVQVRLSGDIRPECAIGSPAGSALTVHAAEMDRPGSIEFPFLLTCNAPFSYRLEAQHGALVNNGAGAAPNGFATALPYDVTVHIPTDGVSIEDHCSSETIQVGQVTCPFSSSGSNIALGSAAQLTFTWRSQVARPLSGDYIDRIIFKVSANI